MITKLKETSGDQVRKLLEANNVIILHDTGNRFDIICPDLSCNQKTAFIEYRGDYRYIKCNRDKNCQYNQGLWELVAEKQSIDPNDITKMLEYINSTIGQEFITPIKKDMPTYATFDFKNQDSEFLAHCDQIFKNAFKQNNAQAKTTLDYLKTRGYSAENIKDFNLGFFPDKEELLQVLTKPPYSYQEKEAKELVSKFFARVIYKNANALVEDNKYRITFPWCNKHGEVSTFSFRQNKSIDSKDKYLFMKGEGLKSTSLFNINNTNDNRKTVIVEGTFDALAATYLSSEKVKKNYHFVAMGGSSLTQWQAELLHHNRFTDIVLLIDNDEAGEKYKSSLKKLFEYEIKVSIARIPQEFKVKDVDELLTKYPDSNSLETILENAVRQEMHNKINNLPQEDKEMTMQNNNRAKFESKYHPETQALLDKIKEDQKLSLENKKPLDISSYDNDIRKLKSTLLIDNTGLDKKYNPNFIALDVIPSDIRRFNDLLLEEDEEDKYYNIGRFYQDISKSTDGLKTGFGNLDEHISIQPSSLTFIAGRPGHGKTTVMLNMLKNMIIANPSKSFLFCSYEEPEKDILLKIILSVADAGLNVELEKELGVNLRERALNQFKRYPLCIKEDESGKIFSLTPKLQAAVDKVDEWITTGRLQILELKRNAESVKNSIIKRCIKAAQEGNKPIAAVFIDYVQKLSAEGGSNRQQEIQNVCKILLETVLDKRGGISIIAGAQVNRGVTSLSALSLDSMREAGDIEQDANLVIAVWNEQAGEMDSLISLLAEVEQQILKKSLGILTKLSGDPMEQKKKIEDKITKLRTLRVGGHVPFKIKVLKNRNGKNNGVFELEAYLERSFIKDRL